MSNSDTRATFFAQHKADVLAGGDGLESGRQAGLLLGEIQSNAATFARRTKLAHDLNITVPQLEAEADEAKERCERLLALADRPLAELTSSKWLAALQLPAEATLAQFGQAIARHLDGRLASKQQAQDAAMRASGLREQATRELWASAAPALHERLDDARGKMLFAGKKIEAADRWLRTIDGLVARCRDRCERLFRGNADDAQRRRFEAAKAELEKLQAEAATRPAVEAERTRNASDHAAALAQRNAVLAAMLLPENMRFCGA